MPTVDIILSTGDFQVEYAFNKNEAAYVKYLYIYSVKVHIFFMERKLIKMAFLQGRKKEAKFEMREV